MKERGVISVLLLLTTCLQTLMAQKVVLYKTDGQTIECEATELDSIVFVEDDLVLDDTHGITNGHEWVDLGLPSGTLWATCNVGASSPEEYGDYFAWGEVEPKEEYNWETYKWCKGTSNTMTKYCQDREYGYNGFTDILTELRPEDDAATANWGSAWQMPSLVQIKELIKSEYTTTEWTTQGVKHGLVVTSKRNGNTLFLPAAGFWMGKRYFPVNQGISGMYSSRSLSLEQFESNQTYELIFGSNRILWFSEYRDWGRSVRPVRKQ